jgi:hypothetical protein
MLNFVARAFEKFLVVGLWLNLFGCAFAGVMGGAAMGQSINNFGVETNNLSFLLACVGLILGALVGIISDIVIGGFLVIFVRMGRDIAEFKEDIKKISFGNTII